MDSHIVGGGPASSAYETSIVMLQFFELVRGRRKVRKPDNGFRTVSLTVEEQYCMGCFGIRRHDVWRGVRGQVPGFMFQVVRCRFCGKEGG